MLQRQARRYGNRPLFAAGEVSWRFDEAPTIAARFAGTLAAAGIRPGDRVALMCGNRAEFMEAFSAAPGSARSRCRSMSPRAGRSFSTILNNSGARLLVDRSRISRRTRAMSIMKACVGAHLADRRRYQALRPVGRLPIIDVPPRAEAIAPCAASIRRKRWRSSTRRERPGRRKACAARMRNISGGVFTASAIWKSARATCSAPRCRCSTPTRSGTFHQALLSGATLVAEPRFSASRFWQRLIERRATVTYLLGAMVPILLSQ